ncbi:hypothetical protein N1851_024418 [Merluccius polli]|uniref:Uncharacterized protein n=1 Tax=Merluccius polli TaxID=89951 RepID=A0AA47MF20_MERPO|nr:hypothetical protein N1851_024418 [Merluccius polli]
MYANVKDAYTATPLPPLGKSDHNLVFLHPQYTPLVRRQKHTMRSFRKWSPETDEALRDCFESTDWSVLQESHGEDIEGVTNCTTDYLNFCMDIVVPTRTLVRCYPNNKPWITTDIKNLLNRKKQAFKEGDLTEMKRVQGELKVRLREAKELYKKRIEQKMQRNSIREVWDAMKTIIGSKRSNGTVDGDVVKANELNHFYNRFDVSTPAATMTCVRAGPSRSGSPRRMMVSETESGGGISTETPVVSRISCSVVPLGPTMYLCWDFFTSTEMVVVFLFCSEGGIFGGKCQQIGGSLEP